MGFSSLGGNCPEWNMNPTCLVWMLLVSKQKKNTNPSTCVSAEGHGCESSFKLLSRGQELGALTASITVIILWAGQFKHEGKRDFSAAPPALSPRDEAGGFHSVFSTSLKILFCGVVLALQHCLLHLQKGYWAAAYAVCAQLLFFLVQCGKLFPWFSPSAILLMASAKIQCLWQLSDSNAPSLWKSTFSG